MPPRGSLKKSLGSAKNMFRKNTAQKFNFRLIKLVLVLLILGGVVVLVKQSLANYFVVKKISASLDGVECGDYSTLSDDLKKAKTSILSFNQTLFSQTITNKYKCIDRVVVTKRLPDEIAIKLVGRKSIASLIPEASSSGAIDLKELESTSSSQTAILDFSQRNVDSLPKFLIDGSGFIFAENLISPNGPTIEVNGQSISLDRSFEPVLIQKTVLIVTRLRQLGIEPALIRIDRFNNLLIKDGDLKMVFWLDREINTQLASLQLILQASKIESSQIESIDQRFNKPVVTYGKSR